MSEKQYVVKTKTGEEDKAGTNANVYISIIGTNGRATQALHLDNDDRDDFENGRSDEFTVTGVDVGDVKSILIGHDGRGPDDGWYLDSVTVDGKSVTYDRWLADDEGNYNNYVWLSLP